MSDELRIEERGFFSTYWALVDSDGDELARSDDRRHLEKIAERIARDERDRGGLLDRLFG